MKNGFTLAEVLITIGILGVVSALTLNTLIKNYQEKQAVTQLKKTYSLLGQGLKLAETEHGDISQWSDSENLVNVADDWVNILKNHMKIIKYCGLGDDSPKDCFANGYKWLNPNNKVINDINDNGLVKSVGFVLNNGASVRISAHRKDCKYPIEAGYIDLCGNLYVDINGKKGPNTFGKDTFSFTLKSDKIVPFGTPTATENVDEKFNNYCNVNSTLSSNGEHCTAWVIYNENMDYLHCNDLSWNGKTKCK